MESWHSQLSNDTIFYEIRAILMHFVAMFWFLDIFVNFWVGKNVDFSPFCSFFRPKNVIKIKTWPRNGLNIARVSEKMVSLESWESQLSIGAKLVKSGVNKSPFRGHVLMWWAYLLSSWFIRYAIVSSRIESVRVEIGFLGKISNGPDMHRVDIASVMSLESLRAWDFRIQWYMGGDSIFRSGNPFAYPNSNQNMATNRIYTAAFGSILVSMKSWRIVSFQTTPRSTRTQQYKCDSWPCFDLNLGMQMDSRIWIWNPPLYMWFTLNGKGYIAYRT